MRKFLKLVLAATILTTSISYNVTPSYAAFDETTSKWVFTTKLTELNRSFQNDYKGQFGLLYNLYFLTEQMIWTNTAVRVGSLNFSEYEKNEYLRMLSSNIDTFNKRFVGDSPIGELSYLPFKTKLSNGVKNEKDFDIATIIDTNLIGAATDYGAVTKYLKDVLDDVNSKVKSAKASQPTDANATDKVIDLNKEQLRYVYRTLEAMANENAYLGSLINTDFSGMLPGFVNVQAATDIMNTADYKDLIAKGRDVSKEATNTYGNIDLKSDQSYVEILANVERTSTDPADDSAAAWKPKADKSPDGKYKLTTAYGAILAASSTYIPFNSHLGDKPFLDALKGISGSQFQELEKIYNDLKGRKKPLYMAEGKDFVEGKPFNGTSIILDIQTLNDAVTNFKSMVVFTGKRQWGPIPDTNTFGFYRTKDFADVLNKERELNKSSSGVTQQIPATTTPTSQAASTPPSTQPTTQGSVPTQAISSATITNVTPAGEDMTNNDTTVPIFGFSKSWQNKLQIVFLNNILTTYKKEVSSSSKTDYLFMNPFGDIVTSDDTVIIPGVANPGFYKQDVYPTMTAAWLNSYPKVQPNGTKGFKVDSNDVGKFVALEEKQKDNKEKVFLLRMKSETDAAYISDANGTTNVSYINGFRGIDGTNSSIPLFEVTKYNLDFGVFKSIALSFFGLTDVSNSAYAMSVVYRVLPSVQYHLFPYVPEKDPDGVIASAIGQNMYYTLTNVNGEMTGSLNDLLAQDFIFTNVLVEGLNGSVYASTFRKNITEDYEKIVADQYFGLKKLITDLSRDMLSSLGDVDGALGLKNRYQDPILGKVLLFVSDYLIYILLGLIVLFIINFMRHRMSLQYTLVMTLVAIMVSYAFLQILPVYLPSGYNIIANNVSKKLSYNVLSVKAEKYSQTYGRAGLIGKDGRFQSSTTSINLYRLNERSIRELGNSLDLDPRKLKSGGSVIIDSNTGIYAEGDNIKVNVDKLMADNPITGAYRKGPNGEMVYSLQSDKQYSSVLDYYSPYYLIEDGFINTLNDFLSLYQVPPNTVTYKGGLTKDSFVVNAYLNSQPFLTPGKYVIEDQYTTGEMMQKLKETFPEERATDFLGLANLLSNPSAEAKQTLWYRTLQQNGFYDKTDPDNKRLNDLIEYVNFNTKKFIIDLDVQAGFISDENLVKIVALQALTLFNQRASDWGNYMYPLSLNYQEIPLKDVLLQSLVHDNDRFLSEDMDVVSYLSTETNPFMLLVFDVATSFDYLLLQAVKYVMPLLYISFGILLLAKFLASAQMKTPVKGYLKANAVIFVCFTAQVMVHSVMQHVSPNLGITIMFTIDGLLLFILINIIQSVVFNFTDMGDTLINKKFSWILDKTNMKNITNKLKVSTTSLSQSPTTGYSGSASYGGRYSNDRDLNNVDVTGVGGSTPLNPSMVHASAKQKKKSYYTESEITSDKDTDEANNKDSSDSDTSNNQGSGRYKNL